MVYTCVRAVFPRRLYSGGVHGLYVREGCVSQAVI
jgi:hypothetical protein